MSLISVVLRWHLTVGFHQRQIKIFSPSWGILHCLVLLWYLQWAVSLWLKTIQTILCHPSLALQVISINRQSSKFTEKLIRSFILKSKGREDSTSRAWSLLGQCSWRLCWPSWWSPPCKPSSAPSRSWRGQCRTQWPHLYWTASTTMCSIKKSYKV